MDENRHYPNISQAIGLVILFFGLMLLLAIPLGILDHFVDFSLAAHPATLAVINLVVVGPILIIGLKRTKAPFSEVYPLVPIRPSLLLPMAIMIVGTSILLSEMDNLLRIFLPAPPWFTEAFMDLTQAQTSLWGSIAALVVVAPLTEELLFRGLILRGFCSHYSVQKAVVGSAILFGLIHLNPWQFIGATILGILFAWWFIETRSLLPSLFGHALANALPLVFGAVFHLEIQGYTSEFSPDMTEFQPLWFDLIGLLLTGLGGWSLIQAFQNTES